MGASSVFDKNGDALFASPTLWAVDVWDHGRFVFVGAFEDMEPLAMEYSEGLAAGKIEALFFHPLTDLYQIRRFRLLADTTKRFGYMTRQYGPDKSKILLSKFYKKTQALFGEVDWRVISTRRFLTY